MENLTFEITNWVQERRINGNTFIRATCVQDNMVVSIEVQNSEANNRILVKDKLVKERNRLLQLKKYNSENLVQVGDVI